MYKPPQERLQAEQPALVLADHCIALALVLDLALVLALALALAVCPCPCPCPCSPALVFVTVSVPVSVTVSTQQSSTADESATYPSHQSYLLQPETLSAAHQPPQDGPLY